MPRQKCPSRAIGALLALLFFGANVASADELFAKLDHDEALAKAEAEGKHLFIDFMADWCAPCKFLDRTTWKDESVVKLVNANAVAIKIDVDKQRALASRYGVRALPTMLLVGPDGEEIDRIVGYVNPEAFIEAFQSMLPKTS